MAPSATQAGSSSTFNAAVNLAKYCIGAGILALPYATQQGGLLFSPIMIGVIAGWNWLASSLLMECKHATSAIDFPPHLSSSYSKIAYAGAGNIGVVLTDISIIVTLLGVCVAFQITFATLLREVPGNTLSTTALAVISGLVVYPMSCLRDLDSISSLSLLGMVCLVAGVVAILYHGFQDFGEAAYKELWSLEERADEPSVALWPESVAGASAFLGVTIFCFDICSLAFPIEESMRHKAEFSRAVVWALLCVWAVYVLLGDVGAALYVHDPDGGIGENILSNLPVNSTIALMVRWAMACVGLLTYPITLAPAAQMLEHYATNSPLARYLCRPAAAGGYSAISEADSAAQQAPAAESSVYLRCANRAVMVCATTFVAGAIPCFGMVISLLGGLTIAILDFILPPLLHLRIVGLGVHRRLPVSTDARLAPTQDSSCCEEGASLELVNIARTPPQPEGRSADSVHLVHGKGAPAIPARWGNQQRLLCVDTALLIVGVGVCAMTTSMSVRSIVVQVIEGRTC